MTKWRVSNILLASFILLYLLTSVGLYLQNVRNWREKDHDKVFLKDKRDPLQGCDENCCEVNDAYRKKINAFFQLFRNKSNLLEKEQLALMSSCRILMDDEVLLRALKYGSPNGYSDNKIKSPKELKKYPNNHQLQKKIKDCRPLGYSKTSLPLTALASFPGSGNTWVRHLLQQATGRTKPSRSNC